MTLPQSFLNTLRSATYLSEVFPVDYAVRLELTDQSILSEITDLIYLEGSWIIVDALQNRVLQFEKDGGFIRVVGPKGQGPGEYLTPRSVKRCFDGNFAVFDSTNARIVVYDRDGKFIETTPGFTHMNDFIPRHAFIWTTRKRLFLANAATSRSSDSSHLIVGFTGGNFRILGQFGKPFPYEDKVGKHAYYGFEEIGDFVWVGSPYVSHLEIFDGEGRFLTSLNETRKGALNIHHYENADLEDPREVRSLVGMPRNGKILAVGSLVLVRVGREYDLYDARGNLLKSGLLSDQTFSMLDGFGDWLVCALPQFEDKHAYNAYDLKALRRAGWQEAGHLDENPYLRVGKLRR